MVKKELEKYGYNCKLLTRDSLLYNIPNFFRQISNWKLILKESPDLIFIQRSSNIIDYEMIKLASKNSKLIFDYDDALFHVRFLGRIVSYSHLDKILSVSDYVVAGSHYLEEYANRFNKNVHLVPTPVDTEMFHKVKKKSNNNNQIVIGWLGSGTKYQLRYLKLLKEPLKMLGSKYNIKFKIVSALSKEVREEFENQGYEVDYGLDHWVHISETPQLISDFDVGVMPLLEEPFARGKCSMKALEYMSMGIPVVASAVGENIYVIKNGYNGFLASTSDEWIKYLEKLILDDTLRKAIGQNGQKTIEENYSIKVVVDKLLKIMDTL